MAKKRRGSPKYSVSALQVLMQDFSIEYLEYLNDKDLTDFVTSINPNNEEDLLKLFQRCSVGAYMSGPESYKKAVKLALQEAVSDPKYDYSFAFGEFVFPFAHPDQIENPRRFFSMLWKAIFGNEVEIELQ